MWLVRYLKKMAAIYETTPRDMVLDFTVTIVVCLSLCLMLIMSLSVVFGK